jgi:hypothetical protein
MGNGVSVPLDEILCSVAMQPSSARGERSLVFLPYNSLGSKIRKPNRRGRIARPPPLVISERSNNRWVQAYGERQVEAVYLCDTGGAWLLFERRKEDGEDEPRMGLVALHPHPTAYSVINNGEFEELCKTHPGLFGKAFTEHLPCTLEGLFEVTTAWAYFE